MSDAENTSTLRRGERSRTRSWRAQEKHDIEQEQLKQQRETKRRNDNIRAQKAEKEEGEWEDEDEEDDNEPPPPPISKKASGKRRTSLSPAPAEKPATKPSRQTTETNGDVAQRRLVVQIAARDGRTDHFDFTLKELRSIWNSGGKKSADAGSSSTKEIFASDELQDLGTTEAEERSQASLGKGKPGKTILVSSRNSSRTVSDSSKRKFSGASKATSRISSGASTNSATNSRVPSPRRSAPRSPAKSSGDKRSGSSGVKTKEKSSRARSPSSKLPPVDEQPEDNDDVSTDPNLSDGNFTSGASDTASRLGDTDGAPPRKGGKPKSGDYDGSDAELIDATVDKVCQRLLVKGWFASTSQYNPLIVQTWRYSVRKLGFKRSSKRITIRKLRAIKFRVTSFQGRIKQAIKNQLVSHFKLDEGTTEQIAERAKKLSKKNRFHTKACEGAEPETGYYQGEFLEKAVKHSLFTKKKSGDSIATMYADKFRRMPLPTIALICAFAHFLLKSFIPGELPVKDRKKRKSKKRPDNSNDSGEDSVDDSIDRAKLIELYDHHLQNLQTLRKGDAAVVLKLRVGLWKAGSSYAKFKSPVKGGN
ncbi:hypothetical protein FRC09_008337, partial [Ceratobasidium sp. 395]